MPGLFGGYGSPEVLTRLEHEFSTVWPDCAHRRTGDVVLGGHAFHASGAVTTGKSGQLVGVDGELAFYEDFAPANRSRRPAFAVTLDKVEILSPACGNVVIGEPDAVYLGADWTASFPLYYSAHRDGCYFSSHLRPLARALGATRDDVGVLEFLRHGFTIGSRTPFLGISRVLGGQSLTFRPGAVAPRIAERSGIWAGVDQRFANADAAAEAAAVALRDAVERSMTGRATSAGLMMSAGWDSRTLMAVARAGQRSDHIRCYSHGDPRSRELRIASRIAASQDMAWEAHALDDGMYDIRALERGFARTESVVFPHWHRAGRLLAAAGATRVFAGVFGEILGGRYSTLHALTGVRKAAALFPALIRRGSSAADEASEAGRMSVRALFRARKATHPSFVSADAFASPDEVCDEINGDIARAFDRYDTGGIVASNLLAEAYQADHVGSRYCNVQLLSCRAELDIAMPLCSREVLRIATSTPMHTRMQNELNRRLIARLAPALLRFPMAATLVPAASPIVLQEVSRVVRKGVQGGRWALHAVSRGRIPRPRLQWADYEFLRSGATLMTIVHELRSDLWNREALVTSVQDVMNGSARHDLLPLADRMARVLTLDLLLR